jgi:hypothetical protein
MNRTRMTAIALTAAIALGATAGAALADQRGHGRWSGDIARFHERDWGVWRGGHWYHGNHRGRLAWWWVAGGAWYFYPAPVYPYPNPYEPPVELVAPSAPPPTQFWYYCDAPRGYYPYVPACAGGWRKVPATPPEVQPAPAK